MSDLPSSLLIGKLDIQERYVHSPVGTQIRKGARSLACCTRRLNGAVLQQQKPTRSPMLCPVWPDKDPVLLVSCERLAEKPSLAYRGEGMYPCSELCADSLWFSCRTVNLLGDWGYICTELCSKCL